MLNNFHLLVELIRFHAEHKYRVVVDLVESAEEMENVLIAVRSDFGRSSLVESVLAVAAAELKQPYIDFLHRIRTLLA